MFSGFERERIDVGDTSIFVLRKGRGRPLLLLHGFPQTSLMWHRVAPVLAEQCAVVCADLRGYGASGKPPSSPDHAPYAKSALARDMVRTMRHLGYERFGVAGHDRGGRVAYRAALDHPQSVDALAVLDIVPTGEAFERADARFALAFWPWSFLAQPEPLPERLIAANPEAVVDHALTEWGSDPSLIDPRARAAYVDALRDPAAVHAICEEYRAAATLDVAQDQQDRRDERRISCPTLVLWSEGGVLDRWYAETNGPLGIWQRWATTVDGHAIAGGHFFPEQNPAETAAVLLSFFTSAGPRS